MGITALVVQDYICQIGSGVSVLAIELVKGNGCENAISVEILGLQLVQIFNQHNLYFSSPPTSNLDFVCYIILY